MSANCLGLEVWTGQLRLWSTFWPSPHLHRRWFMSSIYECDLKRSMCVNKTRTVKVFMPSVTQLWFWNVHHHHLYLRQRWVNVLIVITRPPAMYPAADSLTYMPTIRCALPPPPPPPPPHTHTHTHTHTFRVASPEAVSYDLSRCLPTGIFDYARFIFVQHVRIVLQCKTWCKTFVCNFMLNKPLSESESESESTGYKMRLAQHNILQQNIVFSKKILIESSDMTYTRVTANAVYQVK